MTAAFDAPVVAFHGADLPEQPLVVLLHGRGSDEREILTLAPHLPTGATYAAVRAPIAEGGGYAWFANRGIGRPVAESLAATMAWFGAWLDGVAPAGRPVVLIGFSGGAAFAGGLVLSDPDRYAGAAILYGTLPFDAGVPITPHGLALLPVFVAQGDSDTVIPRELLDRTWSHLHTASGAPTQGHRDPGGHAITPSALQQLVGWLRARLTHVVTHGTTSPVARTTGGSGVAWPTVPGGRLADRRGMRPEVSWRIPQQQLSDTSPVPVQERLFARISGLPDVSSGESRISVPGARGLVLGASSGPDEAFLVPEVREFAHLHPAHDGSLHLALPPGQAADLVAHGWGTPHPWAGSRLSLGFTMVFGPRDDDELEVVAGIVAASHAYASGTVGS
ncbi:luciferase domain-containing protein [Knoellia aerolata]|uniref:Phospholipase n=1 Tax=Knoellia aerolata DSM 18566 TaxID=1385519 RepID=A0A0A0K3E8_9MICO|nr:luciferase family protein [Knoellia aerolata]KGN42311.1 phospholipase [Knoellia aerolata DSM 18566]